ncbi:zeta toxin family protein [Rubrivirga sp. S365]|uniref:zeta toxin family protein n=1 Tax=Rubrivirga sp. S365 TaxID=3076080 RepID=UPI0028CA5FEF|nr:zeta toxin family protein [Rubrivirga sp. S365]MDT7857445.1 zeta toxin family protein [Rubrivirga sp. S365]
MKSPRAVLIAGPNGAGKTTFARDYLPGEAEDLRYLNADLIAAGLSPFDPDRAALRAGRLLLALVDEAVARRESFAVETTLSGHGYAQAVPAWQDAGYRVTLIFLALRSVDTAIARVAERVRQGGHDIPVPTIRRRFDAGRRNFDTVFKPLVDDWALFDTSGSAPILLDQSA